MGFCKARALVFALPALSLMVLALAGCAANNISAKAAKPPQQASAPAAAPSAAAPAVSSAATSQPAGTSSSTPANPAATSAEQALIDSVESAYSSGAAHYRNGEMLAARADFDHAVDLMLTSHFDLKKDAALDAEFNRVVDEINGLEMEALKQGNGFSPKIEPSPVDIANDVTFPVNPAIKAEAIAELKTTRSDLPLVINDPVASYIAYFSSRGRGTLIHALERANRYRDMISRILAQQGLPQDLIYQAVAESGFQPRAVNSRSGARGMWQFMPFDDYGLERNSWVDERFDPEKSTIAYAKYMKELYSQLGNWYLAMAAYDWGTGKVQRAVQRTGYADFWELYHRDVLPQETKNYVPIIIAAAIIAKNPKQYGLDSIAPDPPVAADTITTNYQINLHLVADLVGATVQEISDLNPSLLRLSTPPGQSFDLRLPAGTKALYQTRIAEIPLDKRDSWRFHVVQPGETLAGIAHDYHVTPSEIAFVNQMQPGDALAGTDSLVIPVPPAPNWRTGARRTAYRVRHGDTLITIADRFDVTVQQLREWNRLRSDVISAGKTLYVSEPARIVRSRHSRPSKRAQHRTTVSHASSSRKHRNSTHASSSASHRSTHSRGGSSDARTAALNDRH